MTNQKRTTEELQGEGGRGFCIAQHFLPHPTQSSATFAQADPKEWAQVRSTVRNSCFVKRFHFFVAFPRFEFIVRSSCFRISFNVSFPRHLSVFAISYLFGFVAIRPSLHQRSYMYMYLAVNRASHGYAGGGPGVGSLGCWGFRREGSRRASVGQDRLCFLCFSCLPDSPPVSVACTYLMSLFFHRSINTRVLPFDSFPSVATMPYACTVATNPFLLLCLVSLQLFVKPISCRANCAPTKPPRVRIRFPILFCCGSTT